VYDPCVPRGQSMHTFDCPHVTLCVFFFLNEKGDCEVDE
jgi:hypothetical protein